GLGTLIWSPLGGGVLTGKYRRNEKPASDTRFGRQQQGGTMRLTEHNFRIVDAVEDVASELNTTPTAVALAWCLVRPQIDSVIIGPRTLQQLQENFVGFELKLPPEAVKKLTEVSRPNFEGPRSMPYPASRA